MTKKIVVLGSTGSVGRQTLEVVRQHREKFQIVGLAAGSNRDLLMQQAAEFGVKNVAVGPESAELAALPEADFVVGAIVGAAGIGPVLRAIDAGKDIGLANKEVLVSAGDLVMARAKEKGVRILPIDSEHSAIFQCLQTGHTHEVSKLILTASGGPFLNRDDLDRVTIDDALKHPTWQMGKKVTVDSSTLMNKGLEVIEAHHLFRMPLKQIEVIVHPQSTVHSIVEWCDGSMIAQMSEPSMLLPIQYALSYPERLERPMGCYDWAKSATLSFFPPDTGKFKCLELSYRAAEEGGSMPCFMNGANEVLVERFINGDIRWQEIAKHLETLMERHQTSPIDSLDAVMDVDKEARALAKEI